MNILIKHVIRNMRENLGRTTLIILSLFVVSILVAIISLCSIFFFMVADIRSNIVNFDYSVKSIIEERVSTEIVEKVKTKFDVFGVPEPEYGYILDDNGNYVSTVSEGIQVKGALDSKFINLDNEKNVELNDDEVIILAKVAEKFGLNKGDEFEYFGRNGQKNKLKVKYIVKSLTNLGPTQMLTNEATYLKIKGEDQISYNSLFVKFTGNNSQESEDIEQFEIEYGLKFEKFGQLEIDKLIKNFLYPAIIVLILVFAVIFVSLNSIVKIIINERISVIGTFRSIGATKSQMMKILFGEMLMYTAIPSLLGALVGMAATKSISSILKTLFSGLGIEVDINNYIGQIALITIISTISFQMILSVFELIKVSKLSIKDSIFNKHTSIYNYSTLKNVIGIFCLMIGVITIIKHEQLTYWYCLIGILSIFISIALIVPVISKYLIKILDRRKNPIITMAINTLKNSSLQINTNIIFIITVSVSLVVYSFFNYMSFAEKAKENLVKSDIYVEEMGDGIYDKTDEFYKLENVKSVSAIYDINIDNDQYDEIKLANHTIKEIHLVYSNDYEALSKDSNLLDVDDTNMCKNLRKYEIIISDYYKELYNLKQGDIIVLNWKKYEENFIKETPLNLKIVGFTDLSKSKNNTMIISSELGQELNQLLFNGFSNTKYFINLYNNDNTEAKETRKNIISELGILSNGNDGNVFTKDGFISHVKDASKDNMKYMVFIVIVVVGLALIGIINNQTVSFMERRKELATLYSIAMAKKQIKNMILIENVLAFVNSTIASILFYIIISKLVEYALQIMLIPISIKFTISGILVLLLVVGMILLSIQRSMRKHIEKMNVVEEIKYE